MSFRFTRSIFHVPFSIFYLSFVFFITVLTSCTNDLTDVMALPKNDLSPSQIGDSVTMLYSDTSRLKVMVKANRMLMFDKNVSEPLRVLPNGFFVTFFDADEKVSATLKAQYGVYYEMSKKMEAKYKVEVVNKDGVKLETEKLIWNEITRKIHTDAFVTITTAKERIQGHGLESNQDFTHYRLKKISGIFQLQTDGE